jgi:hypothetical protein
MKVSQLRKLIRETIEEVAIDEMARTPGTGGGIKITSAGESALRQAKATGQIPEGIRANHLAILKFLFQAKQDGKRVQKIDYAKQLGVPQPQVNPLFNQLIEKGLAEMEKYQSALPGTSTGSTRQKTDVQAMLGDLDFGDEDMGEEA